MVMVGTRLMDVGEREGLRECKICVDGDAQVCLKSTTNDGCHNSCDADCRFRHLDPARFKNGLPPALATPAMVAKQSKAMRIFGVAHGGFRCVPFVDPGDRVRAIEKLRAMASGGNLPPAVYDSVVTSGEPHEGKLRALITGSAKALTGLCVPGPVKAFDSAVGAPEDSPDGRSAVERGKAWRAEVVKRVSAEDAKLDAPVMWAARVMDGIVAARESSGDAGDVDDAFAITMTVGVGRGSRVLSAFCSRYAPLTPNEAATVASGYRSFTHSPLLMVYPTSASDPMLGEFQLTRVEVCGAMFHALDAGSTVAGHESQCVLTSHSLMDLLYDGAPVTQAIVVARGDAIAAAFTAQATAALKSLGEAPRELTVREAELYADVVDILKWRDHDARLSVHIGHGLPEHLVFSTRPWERMRLVIVACVAPNASVRAYVITGELYDIEADDAWTAWILVYKNHAVGMRLADSTYKGEHGASAFLESMQCSGIMPVAMTACSWAAVVAARGSGGTTEPMLPADLLRKCVDLDDDPFRARGEPSASDRGLMTGAERRRFRSFESVEFSLPPIIERWCRRFVRGAGAAGATVDAALMGGSVLPPALPGFGGQGLGVAEDENRGGGAVGANSLGRMAMLAFVCDDLKEYTEVLSERGGEMWSEKEPLTVQQGMLKASLLDSEGLDYAVWDGRGDDRNDFLDWIVRQVEHRVAPGRDVAGDSAASVDGVGCIGPPLRRPVT